MNRALLYILLLVVLCGFAYALVTYGPKVPSSTPSTEGGVLVSVQSDHEDTATSSVSAEYPQFGIPAVDSQIKSAVDAAVSDFESIPPNPPDSATSQNQFNGTFDTIYAGPDVASVELVFSQYTGGAHNNTVVQAVNVNRQTGKQLTLDDALAMTGLTLQQVSDGATAQLATKLGNDFIFPDGASPSADNYSTFIVSADSVTFIFNDYQVAPYSDGPQQAVFPRIK